MAMHHQLPKGCGLAASQRSPTLSTGGLAQYGETVTCMLSRGRLFTAVFVQLDASGQATTAATDIVSWSTFAGSSGMTTTGDTSANQFAVVGLPMTGGDAAIAVSEFFWCQTWGGRILMPDGSTAVGNTLLGDGSVAAGDGLMAHASTDGMVDTWATNPQYLIGVAYENDAPGLNLFCLNCYFAPRF